MQYYYYNINTQTPAAHIELWKHLSHKKNWRIVELPNGFFQTERKDLSDCCKACTKNACECSWIGVTRRETVLLAENAINQSVEHYTKKLEFLEGPKVVKTFK